MPFRPRSSTFEEDLRRSPLRTGSKPVSPFVTEVDEDIQNMDMRRPATGDRESAMDIERRSLTPFQQGLRSSMVQMGAVAPGIEALGRGILGDEEGAVDAANRAQSRLDRAGEIAPRTGSLKGVIEGKDDFGDWAAGMLGTQVPVLATFMGSAGVGGLAARVAQRGVVKSATARAAAARAAQQQGTGTAQAARSATDLMRKTMDTVAKREQLSSIGTGMTAGVGLYGAETSQFITDPDAEGSVRERALAGLAGATMASVASLAPSLVALKNMGLGATMMQRTQMNAKSFMQRVPQAAGKQFMYEGAAEGFAELSKTWAHTWINDNIDMFSTEQLWKYAEATAVGGMMGFGIGGATSIRLRDIGLTEQRILNFRSRKEEMASRRRAEPDNARAAEAFEALEDDVRAQYGDSEESAWIGFMKEFKFDGATTLGVGDVVASNFQGMNRKEAGFFLRLLVDPRAADKASRGLEQPQFLEDGVTPNPALGQPPRTMTDEAYDALAAVVGEQNMASVMEAGRQKLALMEERRAELDNRTLREHSLDTSENPQPLNVLRSNVPIGQVPMDSLQAIDNYLAMELQRREQGGLSEPQQQSMRQLGIESIPEFFPQPGTEGIAQQSDAPRTQRSRIDEQDAELRGIGTVGERAERIEFYVRNLSTEQIQQDRAALQEELPSRRKRRASAEMLRRELQQREEVLRELRGEPVERAVPGMYVGENIPVTRSAELAEDAPPTTDYIAPGTQDAETRVSLPFAMDERMAGEAARTPSKSGRNRAKVIGSYWAGGGAAAEQAARLNAERGAPSTAEDGAFARVETVDRALALMGILPPAASQPQAASLSLRPRLAPADPSRPLAPGEAPPTVEGQVVSEEQGQAFLDAANDMLAKERGGEEPSFHTREFTDIEQFTPETAQRAVDFLSRFETVVTEALPPGMSGREQRVFTQRELDKIMPSKAKVPLDDRGFVTARRKRIVDGKEVLETSPVNVITALQYMMPKMDDFAATGMSKEARRKAGADFKQFGMAVVPGGISLENLSRMYRAAIGAIKEQTKFDVEVPRDMVVFIRKGGELITSEMLDKTGEGRKRARAFAGDSPRDLRRQIKSIDAQISQFENEASDISLKHMRLRRATLDNKYKEAVAKEKAEAEKQTKRLASLTKRADRLEQSIRDFLGVKGDSEAMQALREDVGSRLAELSVAQPTKLGPNNTRVPMAASEAAIERYALRVTQELLNTPEKARDGKPVKTPLQAVEGRLRRARDAIAAKDVLEAATKLSLLLPRDAHPNALRREFIRNEIRGQHESTYSDPMEGFTILGDMTDGTRNQEARNAEVQAKISALQIETARLYDEASAQKDVDKAKEIRKQAGELYSEMKILEEALEGLEVPVDGTEPVVLSRSQIIQVLRDQSKPGEPRTLESLLESVVQRGVEQKETSLRREITATEKRLSALRKAKGGNRSEIFFLKERVKYLKANVTALSEYRKRLPEDMAKKVRTLSRLQLAQNDKTSTARAEKIRRLVSEIADTVNDTTPEFRKLPARKYGERTMTYAGVGARAKKLPPAVAEQMGKIAAWLERQGYTLNTGNATGADKAFRDNVTTNKNVFYPEDATDQTRAIAREIHPYGSGLAESTVDLMARNTNQIFGRNLDTPVDFVLTWTPDGIENGVYRTISETGGTGQAIDMASRKGIPVINMEKEDWQQRLREVLGMQQDMTVAEPVATQATPEATPQATPDSPQAALDFSTPRAEPLPKARIPRYKMPTVIQEGGGKKTWSDARLKRDVFRDALKHKVSELKENGGTMGMLADRNDPNKPNDPDNVSRLPSENPMWFQQINETRGTSVKYVRKTVEKALAGNTLRHKEAWVVETMLDYISAERMGADTYRGEGPESVSGLLSILREQRRILEETEKGDLKLQRDLPDATRQNSNRDSAAETTDTTESLFDLTAKDAATLQSAKRDPKYARASADSIKELKDVLSEIEGAKRKKGGLQRLGNRSQGTMFAIIRGHKEIKKGLEVAQKLMGQYSKVLNLDTPHLLIDMTNALDPAFNPAMWTVRLPIELIDALGYETTHRAYDSAVNTVIHELSHALEFEIAIKSSLNQRRAVAEEYNVWRTEQDALIEKRRAENVPEHLIAAEITYGKRGRGIPEGFEDTELSLDYALHPREWFADTATRIISGEQTNVKSPLAIRMLRSFGLAFKKLLNFFGKEYKNIENYADSPQLRALITNWALNETLPEYAAGVERVASVDITKSHKSLGDRKTLQNLARAMRNDTTQAQRDSEVSYLNEVVRGLKLRGLKIARVLTRAEVEAKLNQPRDLDATDGLAFSEIDPETGEITTQIWVNERITDPVERMSVLHHEMGHAVINHMAYSLDEKQAAKIIEAYGKWKAGAERGSVASAIKSRQSLLNLISARHGDTTQLSQLSKAEKAELLDFHEWFADQIGRWADTNKRPRTVAGKFFKAIAELIKRLVARNAEAGLPDATVAQLLNHLWDAKAPNAAIRKHNIWRHFKEEGAMSQSGVVQGIIKRLDQQFGESPIPGNRRFAGAVIMDVAPTSIDAFWAVRDYAIGQMSMTERRAISRALLTPSVQRTLSEANKIMASKHQFVPSDSYSQIALAYLLWQTGRLELKPVHAKIFDKAIDFGHKVTGMAREHQQAEQVFAAIRADVFGGRENLLQKEAPDYSQLHKGRYVLETAALSEIASWEALYNIAENADNAGTMKLIEKLVMGSKVIPARNKTDVIMDMQSAVYTTEFLDRFKNASDFVLNPDKQFQLVKIIGRQPYQNAARAMYNFMAGTKDFLRNSMLAGKLFGGEAMRGRAARNMAMHQLQKLIYTDVLQEGGSEGFVNAKDRLSGQAYTEWTKIWEVLDGDQQVALREELLERSTSSDTKVRRAINQTRAFLRKQRKYFAEVGVPMGTIDKNYFPWSFDAERMNKKSNTILSTWTDARYREHWFKVLQEHYPDAMGGKKDFDSTEHYHSYVKAYVASIAFENGFAEGHAPAPDAISTRPFVGAANKRDLNFLSDEKIAPKEHIELLNSLFDDNINTTMAKYISQAVKKVEYTRRFGLYNEKLNQLLKQAKELGATHADIELMENMVKSATGRHGLEVASFWKKVADPINKLFAPIRDDNGLPFKTRELAMRKMKDLDVQGEVIKTELGYEIKRDITADPRRFRQNMGYLIVFQNYTKLALSALTNVADIAGIAFRTGDLNIALDAYKWGIQKVVRDFKNRKLDPEMKRQEMGYIYRLMEEMGMVAQASVSEHLGLQYGSVHMAGRAKRWNDALFRWNGMEYLTRTTRAMATVAGLEFIAKHTRLAGQGNEASIEQLTQLGIDPRDVTLTEDGRLQLLDAVEVNELLEKTGIGSATGADVMAQQGEVLSAELDALARDERVKRALFRMVDESVLRPATWQRPTWANDPNWQIFSHLKGFMYTYHERVLRRIIGRAAQGDIMPLVMAAGYVGVMIAADWLRDFIQWGPKGNPMKARWGIAERVGDGVHRSGLPGAYTFIPDMLKTQRYGRSTLAQLGGTTTSDIERWYRVATGQGDLGTAIRRSTPASQIWYDPAANWGSWMMGDALEPRSVEDITGLPLIRTSWGLKL